MSAFGSPFGAPASSASNTNSTPAPSLFGNANASTQNATTSNTGSSIPNFFANSAALGGGASNAGGTGPTPGLFGGGNAGGTSSAPGMFGGAAATGGASTTPNLFGGSAATGTTSSLFGGGAATGGTGTTPSAFGGGASNLFGAAARNNAAPSSTPGSGPTGNSGGLFGNTGALGLGAAPPLGSAGTNAPVPNFFGTPPASGAGTSGVTAPPSFFATPPASGATGPTSNLFGGASSSTTNASTSNANPSSIPNFFGKPAEKKDAAAPGLPTFNLPGSSTGEKKDGVPAPASAFNLFGNKDSGAAGGEKKDGAPASTSPFTLGPKDSGSTTGEKKDGAAASTPAFGGLFGNKATGASGSEKKDTAAPSGFSLGGGTAAKDASAATSAFSLGGATAAKDGDKSKGASPATAAGTSAASAAPAVSVPPPSMLRGKTIEEIVNRWSTDLDTHVREFNKFAGEVAVWDRALIENGNNLATLFAHVLAAEQEQNDIDQSLDHIEQQQKDLAATLEAYERSTDEILGGRGNNLRALDTGPADTERDRNYMLATELHGHLDDLSGSLSQMIDAVNVLGLQSPAGAQDGAEDPMGQIGQILNSHLESLMWIDGAAREVEAKITDVEKRVRAAGDSGLGSTSRPRGLGLGR